ncbi:MAG: aminoglycoside phosphotransferase family protein [Microlunatus sp.]|nr:aminoglycoside phosphotransferase family protein [Microlunatus sp.]
MAPRQTHHLRRDGDLITKTYRTWQRGEPRREWGTLTRLAESAPGLAPEPIAADLGAEPPWITMTVLPGRPIAGRWTDDQVALLAGAMERLWQTPTDGLDSIGVHRPAYWVELAAATARPDGPEGELYDRVVEWFAELDVLLDGSAAQILGQGDPQAGNMIFDGRQVRLVDFEDAGASDLCFELANFAEHLGNRGTGLERLADHFEVDHQRLWLCRRLLASFWFLRLLPVRAERGADFAHQTERLVDLLGRP